MQIEEHEFGQLMIGDCIVIGEITAGADVELGVVSQIIDIANDHFKGEPWGYISNRINSYSLQPQVHHEAPKFEKNMIAFAVVTSRNNRGQFVGLEKHIAGDSYSFAVFVTLEDAITWMKQELSKES